eukprot:CAMPEP_0177155776 /NCGR_PEP_ID=MMETSP0367-20130122/2354_1 /TAXON_ID=447022 ORGANISM="Scrippsiella hangoei-like, Strain SHHI-4" /NCGR_SAMPLE_ID=MMETSP0367 /ASSEMBLY_ACC=CAM_ASM_000362 /LENGTH=171 /DNA_ID=CAMNT_0018601147 /DNA_START=60 /DNA_END=572 /DNA_ORIENTATION=+
MSSSFSAPCSPPRLAQDVLERILPLRPRALLRVEHRDGLQLRRPRRGSQLRGLTLEESLLLQQGLVARLAEPKLSGQLPQPHLEDLSLGHCLDQIPLHHVAMPLPGDDVQAPAAATAPGRNVVATRGRGVRGHLGLVLKHLHRPPPPRILLLRGRQSERLHRRLRDTTLGK